MESLDHGDTRIFKRHIHFIICEFMKSNCQELWALGMHVLLYRDDRLLIRWTEFAIHKINLPLCYTLNNLHMRDNKIRLEVVRSTTKP